jgi:hypothetical protein
VPDKSGSPHAVRGGVHAVDVDFAAGTDALAAIACAETRGVDILPVTADLKVRTTAAQETRSNEKRAANLSSPPPCCAITRLLDYPITQFRSRFAR